ncbi:MAG: GntG family PLP-dependent aldolase [Dehalococcoidia bacterium]|nr:GntG family PLP-dependent aldolase [Dehalococcoidia bacterium]
MIDLRSDTVSKPSLAMRKIIMNSDVGDDVIGDDPTVKRLEKLSAEIVGKQAALYVPSGTMGNLIALLVHCEINKAAIVGSESHILWHEGLGATKMGGIHLSQIKNESDGTFSEDELLNFTNDQVSLLGVLCIENTQNRCGGRVLNSSYIANIARFSKTVDCPVHMDGARIFNAAIALNCNVQDLTKDVDSVSFCFSKGLGAPVGSVLCGNDEFIRKAKKIRRNLGGGMRQVGIIASAAEYALLNNIDRLAEDHENAKLLAQHLLKFPCLEIDLKSIETNIIYAKIIGIDGDKLVASLARHGVQVSQPKTKQEIRIVTHIDISREQVLEAVSIFEKVISNISD